MVADKLTLAIFALIILFVVILFFVIFLNICAMATGAMKCKCYLYHTQIYYLLHETPYLTNTYNSILFGTRPFMNAKIRKNMYLDSNIRKKYYICVAYKQEFNNFL